VTTVTEREFIYFKPIGQNKKTNIWFVMNKTHDYPLGTIKWYGSWRQYCFFTDTGEVILSHRCMNQINEFIRRMNQEQKDGKHGKDNL